MNFLFFLQIIFESLPLSSSGHLKLFSLYFAPLSSWLEELAHVPTLLVMTLFFRTHIYGWIMDRTFAQKVRDIFLLTLATGITGIFFIANRLNYLPRFSLPLGFALTAFLLFFVARMPHGRERVWNFSDAVLFGLVQGAALVFPGLSRFASVYTMSRWRGLDVHSAFVYTWALQLPVCCVAGLQCLVTLWKNNLWSELQPTSASSFLGGTFLLVIALIMAYILLEIMYRICIQKKEWMVGIYLLIPLLVSLWYF